MYNGINEMIDDLMEHISTENNVLFPRALAGNNHQPGILPDGGCKLRLIRPTNQRYAVSPVSASATGQNN